VQPNSASIPGLHSISLTYQNNDTTSPLAEDIGTLGVAAIAAGLPANAIMLWSEYTLFSTGAGLPPGPGGLLGAAEVRIECVCCCEQ